MTWAGDAEEMYRYLTGETDKNRLRYEDWTGPMAASAGRICLRIDSEMGTRWVRRTPDEGFVCCVPWGPDETFRTTWREELQRWLETYDPEPVLVEATPFAQGSSPETEVSP